MASQLRLRRTNTSSDRSKTIETIWKNGIVAASLRLQTLLLRPTRYEIQVEYISGKGNAVADTLIPVDPLSPKPMDAKQMDAIPVCQVTATVPATENRLDRTRVATCADPALSQLRHYKSHGWSLQKHQLPEQVQHYWSYREEFAVIFNAHQPVIPNSQRLEYLKGLHAGHRERRKPC